MIGAATADAAVGGGAVVVVGVCFFFFNSPHSFLLFPSFSFGFSSPSRQGVLNAWLTCLFHTICIFVLFSQHFAFAKNLYRRTVQLLLLLQEQSNVKYQRILFIIAQFKRERQREKERERKEKARKSVAIRLQTMNR